MPKKKILIRMGSLRHGGAEKVLVTFLKNISKDKYEIDLLLNVQTGKYVEEVPQWINVKGIINHDFITSNALHVLPKKVFFKLKLFLFQSFPMLMYRFVLHQKKYDTVLFAHHDLLDEALRNHTSDQKIIWVHNDLLSIPSYTKSWIEKMKHLNQIWVISEKIQNDFQQILDTQYHSKIKKIINPIDTDEMLQSAQDVLSQPIGNTPTSFLTIGTKVSQKGLDRLFEVHQKLLDENVFHTMYIIGDGKDMEQLKQEAQSYSETFQFLGFQKNPYPFMKEIPFYILSSRYEGFPTVLVEAVLFQQKIISTNVSGASDILEGGKKGWIVDNTTDALFEAIKKAIIDTHAFDNQQKEIQKPLPFSLQNSVEHLEFLLDE